MKIRNDDINILILSAGRRVELVNCFKAARDRLGIAGKVIACDASDLAPALYFADVRQQALEALRDEIAAQTQQMRLSLAELQREIVEERKLWRGRVRRGKAQGFVYGVIGGFLGGYLVRRNNP